MIAPELASSEEPRDPSPDLDTQSAVAPREQPPTVERIIQETPASPAPTEQLADQARLAQSESTLRADYEKYLADRDRQLASLRELRGKKAALEGDNLRASEQLGKAWFWQRQLRQDLRRRLVQDKEALRRVNEEGRQTAEDLQYAKEVLVRLRTAMNEVQRDLEALTKNQPVEAVRSATSAPGAEAQIQRD